MSLKTFTSEVRHAVRNDFVIRIFLYAALAVMVIAIVLTYITSQNVSIATDPVEKLGLERITGTNGEQFISTPDGVCIIEVSYITDEETGELIILAEQNDMQIAITSASDVMRFCK